MQGEIQGGFHRILNAAPKSPVRKSVPSAALGVLLAALNPIVRAEPSFAIHGTLTHEQFGPHGFQKQYRFAANSQGCEWSISTVQEPADLVNEVRAVKNASGLFVVPDLSASQAQRKERGEAVGPNRAQAMVFTNCVPNCILAPELGPIWLTFLSSCSLKEADPKRFPPPTFLNIAGGCPVPPFVAYTQPAWWQTEEDTGLPVFFESADFEGFQHGVSGEHLVRLRRYEPPFDHGFTNLVFRVIAQTNIGPWRFPSIAVLDVCWIRQGRLEKIHRFHIAANQIELTPERAVSNPTLPGVTLVSDARLANASSSAVLEYLATNRFPESSELEDLEATPGTYAHAISLNPPRIHSERTGWLLFWTSGGLFTTALAILIRFAGPGHFRPDSSHHGNENL
jgi:hypothetical protein